MTSYFPEDEFYESGFSACSERYHAQVEELLAIMDKLEIDVDDDSQFWDYYSLVNDDSFTEVKETVKKLYNIQIELEDYIWEVAAKIHDEQMN